MGILPQMMRLRDPEALCDEALEPFHLAWMRASWRGKLRRLYQAGRLSEDPDWARALGISLRRLEDVCRQAAFGAAWSAVEETSPLLRGRHVLRPADLPAEIKRARRGLALLRKVWTTRATIHPAGSGRNAESGRRRRWAASVR
jgi:hypothetical protein